MSAKTFAWRAGAFVRSVLPAQPAHWLILVGSTLLYISANLRWWAGPIPSSASTIRWQLCGVLLSRLLIVAGAAGFYVSLVPRILRTPRPFYVLFVSTGIVFTVMVSVAVASLTSQLPRASVIAQATKNDYGLHGNALKVLALDFGTGFWLAALGATLVAIFGLLFRHERATLPISISARQVERGHAGLEFEPIDQRRTMRFVWMMISLVPVAYFFASVPFAMFYVMLKNDFLGAHLRYIEWGSEISFALSLFLLILVAMRPDAVKSLRESFRLPPVIYLGVAVTLPIVLSAIWPLLSYVYDRIHWAAFDFSMYDAPQLTTYFTFPIWLWLWALVPALVEEIAWRGFLQPRFVRKYGIARGIFLLGLAWGAFHFSGDFHSNMNARVIVITLIHRLYTTVALSYVLGWLTIRSGSVLPAALAHGFYNIILNLPVHTPLWLMPALWAACAWILFRYFPVQVADEGVAPQPGPTLEPAI